MSKDTKSFKEWTDQYVSDNIHKLKAPMVIDRKTGQAYDPKIKFDEMMAREDIQAVFKRLAVR